MGSAWLYPVAVSVRYTHPEIEGDVYRPILVWIVSTSAANAMTGALNWAEALPPVSQNLKPECKAFAESAAIMNRAIEVDCIGESCKAACVDRCVLKAEKGLATGIEG